MSSNNVLPTSWANFRESQFLLKWKCRYKIKTLNTYISSFAYSSRLLVGADPSFLFVILLDKLPYDKYVCGALCLFICTLNNTHAARLLSAYPEKCRRHAGTLTSWTGWWEKTFLHLLPPASRLCTLSVQGYWCWILWRKPKMLWHWFWLNRGTNCRLRWPLLRLQLLGVPCCTEFQTSPYYLILTVVSFVFKRSNESLNARAVTDVIVTDNINAFKMQGFDFKKEIERWGNISNKSGILKVMCKQNSSELSPEWGN
jgi:hypothetical protein